MAFKDIIVDTDATEAGLRRARIAAKIAALHGGYLIGLFIQTPQTPPLDLPVFNDLGLQTGTRDAVLQQIAADEERALREGEQAFRNELARAQVEGEWLVLDGRSPDLIDAQARCADLIVLGQPLTGEGAKPVDTNFPAELALACGRPVLVIPRAGTFETLGERVLVAWNGSREAARAVSDAMPFLECANFVAVLAVEPPWREIDEGMCALSNLVSHLKRHGVSAERYVVQAPEHMAGDEIIAQAERFACDLVVMGAYGHSHMREIVLGGATRTLLKRMTVPSLLSH